MPAAIDDASEARETEPACVTPQPFQAEGQTLLCERERDGVKWETAGDGRAHDFNIITQNVHHISKAGVKGTVYLKYGNSVEGGTLLLGDLPEVRR